MVSFLIEARKNDVSIAPALGKNVLRTTFTNDCKAWCVKVTTSLRQTLFTFGFLCFDNFLFPKYYPIFIDNVVGNSAAEKMMAGHRRLGSCSRQNHWWSDHRSGEQWYRYVLRTHQIGRKKGNSFLILPDARIGHLLYVRFREHTDSHENVKSASVSRFT